jgi:hypothetical protein
MSHSLANDLQDRFGSSDEDEDDEEIVGWMGGPGEFEPRSRETGETDDDDENVRAFGNRGLFHERWDAYFGDDDEFGFRGLKSVIRTEERGAMVKLPRHYIRLQ